MADHIGDREPKRPPSSPVPTPGDTQPNLKPIGNQRDAAADERDRRAAVRDELAAARDERAAARDASEAASDWLSDEHRVRVLATLEHAAADRQRSADDRRRARADRECATQDRKDAAGDRRLAEADDLTGVKRRGAGLEALENEMDRARRTGVNLVAAYIDVNGLKAINDTQGHLAGDDILRAVAGGLRDQVRAYDLIIRLGGDEFLCVLAGLSIEQARDRFRRMTDEVSLGLSEMLDSDSPLDLIGRADADLLLANTRRGKQPVDEA